jgi:sortase (surface protein transpeptidase)
VIVPDRRVDAPVDPAGVRPGGELDVPADGERLGWWIGSAQPGAERGTVLIAGHVDTVDDGPGALYGLERLPMGSRVDVRTGDRTVAYQVVARRSYAKTRLPADLFRVDGPPRLALVTCGGAFRDGSYDRNVVVYAEPVGG